MPPVTATPLDAEQAARELEASGRSKTRAGGALLYLAAVGFAVHVASCALMYVDTGDYALLFFPGMIGCAAIGAIATLEVALGASLASAGARQESLGRRLRGLEVGVAPLVGPERGALLHAGLSF